jgi:hypothetical protein
MTRRSRRGTELFDVEQLEPVEGEQRRARSAEKYE